MTIYENSLEDSGPGARINALSRLKKLPGFSEIADQMPIRGFSLHLGDGSRWWIAGSPSTSSLLEKMATIMQLQEGNDLEDGHILFIYDKYEDSHLLQPSRLQAEGWLNLHPFSEQFFFHPGLRHLLAECDSIRFPNGPYNLMCLTLPAIFWETINRGGLPFHAALLEYQGQGVILAAKGDIGKSTCARRVPPPWRAPCDDEVLTVLSPEGRYLAHPFPTWSDYVWERAANTWKVEDTLPLAGIFFFEQSPEDDCHPLVGYQAGLAGLYSAGQNMSRFIRWCDPAYARELKLAMLANACEIVKRVPAFHLQVSLTGRVWEKIEAALGWR